MSGLEAPRVRGPEGCPEKLESSHHGSRRGTFKKEEVMPGSHAIERSRGKGSARRRSLVTSAWKIPGTGGCGSSMDREARREGIVENALGSWEGQETRKDTYGDYDDNSDSSFLMELMCQALCQTSNVLLTMPLR